MVKNKNEMCVFLFNKYGKITTQVQGFMQIANKSKFSNSLEIMKKWKNC